MDARQCWGAWDIFRVLNFSDAHSGEQKVPGEARKNVKANILGKSIKK